MWDKALEAIMNSSKESSVYVGCDSVCFKKGKQWYARYATVVIVHHASRHGASIFHNVETLPDYGNIKMRMMNEVMFASNAALEVVDFLDGRHMEIHLDINPSPKHKSNVAMREALAYVMGMNQVKAKLKPEAWAASHASDHCARGKALTMA